VAAIDVSELHRMENGKGKPTRMYCKDCDTIWVESPVCWSCYEPGVLYAAENSR
jgi:hypothetical protein